MPRSIVIPAGQTVPRLAVIPTALTPWQTGASARKMKAPDYLTLPVGSTVRATLVRNNSGDLENSRRRLNWGPAAVKRDRRLQFVTSFAHLPGNWSPNNKFQPFVQRRWLMHARARERPKGALWILVDEEIRKPCKRLLWYSAARGETLHVIFTTRRAV